MKKPHVKTKYISIYLKDAQSNEIDEEIVYRGSAWTLSVEDDSIHIYKNGQFYCDHNFDNIINVVEN